MSPGVAKRLWRKYHGNLLEDRLKTPLSIPEWLKNELAHVTGLSVEYWYMYVP